MKSYITFILIVTLCIPFTVTSQSLEMYSPMTVQNELRTNASAVVKSEAIKIIIDDYDKMTVSTKRIVAVFNKSGNKHQNAVEFYDNNTKINSIEAIIYDAIGNKIKKIKAKDFLDESAVSGGTLYSDNRVKYLEYTPTSYPYTIEFTSEVTYKSTAFIPKWYPIDGYNLAVERSEYQIINNSGIEIKTKSKNFDSGSIKQLSDLHVVAENLPAVRYESYNTGLNTLVPNLKGALTIFNMEGVKGYLSVQKRFQKQLSIK